MARTRGPNEEGASEANKGKGIATSSSTAKKRKAPEKKAKPAKENTQGKATSKKKPSSRALYDKLLTIPIEQTHVVDEEILERLEIREDVLLLFENMGLRDFMTMRESAQQVLTCEVLSTIKGYSFDPEDPDDEERFAKYGRGCVFFKVKNREFELSFDDICDAFRFPVDVPNSESQFRYPIGELERLWSTIGTGNYVPGRTKVQCIRNPAIRYAYKALMHAFYAKVEVDTVTTEGLMILGTGLKPILPTLADGGEFHGPDRIPSLAAVLVSHLLDTRDWAWTTTNKKAFIGCGGIITALVKKKSKEVVIIRNELPLMDETYLRRSRFMKKRGEHFAFQFKPQTNMLVKVLIPNPAITRLDRLENVVFNPPRELYVDYEGTPENVYGAARYNFDPYTGPMNTAVASVQAHDRINKLSRHVTWQDRMMAKMAKAMRGMKKKIKDLEKKTAGCTCRGGEASEPVMRMETSGEESSHRASRKAKGKARARTPSPTSSNESIDLDTDCSDSPSPSHID